MADIKACPPSKPWRVYGPREFSTDHRSQRAAYERVKSLTRHLGTKATVNHWEDGSWKLYERVEPSTPEEAPF